MKYLFLVVLFTSWAQANVLTLDPGFAHPTGSCKAGKPSGPIWFFKQWHLGPKLDTSDIKKSEALPQEQNQKAIFDQLDAWIGSGKLKTIVTEGCSSGEMTETTPLKFNGWDVTGLKTQAGKPDYDLILTSVTLKLVAKYGSTIHVICGDDEELSRKNALAFSDARGEVGYLSRLEQYKNDPVRAASYLEDVVKLYHMPPQTTVEQGISRLKAELRSSVNQVEQFIAKRNHHLVDVTAAVMQAKSTPEGLAIVYGGAHAEGARILMEERGLNCEIVEPKGYPEDDRDEGKMIERLKELLQ